MEERVFKLSESMEIRFVKLDEIRERDVNARLMDAGKFDTLVNNIKREGMIESLPLVHLIDGDAKYEIISGHHRVRAARRAGMEEIPVIVITRNLTEDEVISKQLSHNSLEGYDDKDVLKRLYDAIEDFDMRVASGVTDLEDAISGVSIPPVDVDINFDLEPILIMFMKPEIDKFEKLLEDCKATAEKKYLANMTEYKKFVKVVNSVAEYKNLRNIAGIMSSICDLARERLNELKEETNE